MQLGLAAKSAEELPVGAGSQKPDVSDLSGKMRERERKAETILVKSLLPKETKEIVLELAGVAKRFLGCSKLGRVVEKKL